jgi:hypothetical protein
MIRKRSVEGILLALAAAASVAVILGSSDETPRPEILGEIRGDSNRVSEDSIRELPPRSPARAVLRWFQAAQRGDVAAVLGLTSKRAIERVGTARMIEVVWGGRPQLGRPVPVAVRKRGNRGAVRVLVLVYKPGSYVPEGGVPLTLETVRDQRRWRVADARYLVSTKRDRARAYRSLLRTSKRPLLPPSALGTRVGDRQRATVPRPGPLQSRQRLLPMSRLDGRR